jgi:hypothetical protein
LERVTLRGWDPSVDVRVRAIQPSML